MNIASRVLVSFGRTDPLHLTEATHDLLGEGPTYIWGDGFSRSKPAWAVEIVGRLELGYYEVVYCGHGATLLEATAAGCETRVLTRLPPNIEFIDGWSAGHLDHSGQVVRWWEPGSMARMAGEIAGRRAAMVQV